MPEQRLNFIQQIVRFFLTSRLSIVLAIGIFIIGIAAIMITPREEEPQIIVPMADIMVQVPGASAEEVEQLVTTPLESILYQVDGVEYVYSISKPDASMVTVRFYVGENRENSLLKIHNALQKNLDRVPSVVRNWTVKPVEIDDVPIVMLTLYPSDKSNFSDFELRRVAEELSARLAEIENTSFVTINGGRSREVRVEIDPLRLAGYSLSPQEVIAALEQADHSITAGSFDRQNKTLTVRSHSFLTSPKEAEKIVVGSFTENAQLRPIYLRDVANVIDGPQEPTAYSRIGFSDTYANDNGLNNRNSSKPAVTIAVSKKKGTNAVLVAENVITKAEELKAILPSGVEIAITRNYGESAQNKVSDLLGSLGFAIITVIALLAFFLGWREAVIVAFAVPISFSLALFVNYLFGFTINRVTLFALILSLGLVVDDPITNVDNIQRHILRGKKNPLQATLDAVREVLPPVIMSTLTIIVSFLPLFFITGMMGPYMAPMAANVPLTVSFSTFAALTLVPWMAYNLLKKRQQNSTLEKKKKRETPSWLRNGYYTLINPFLSSSRKRKILTFGIILALLASCSLAAMRLVPLKMLPFDNKNEFQILVDMPESTSLEATDKVIRELEQLLRGAPEVTNFITFTGNGSPMDFNGMVRHYYWRSAPHAADIRVNLLDKSERELQSHDIALRLRPDVERIVHANGGKVKIVESPPGPPVISTITTEVYGQESTAYSTLIEGADHIAGVMSEEPFVVDIDTSAEAPHQVLDFAIDKEKAALHGITTETIVNTLRTVLGGVQAATIHSPNERQPLPVIVRLPEHLRNGREALDNIQIKTDTGKMMPLAELGSFAFVEADQPIYHKNLKRVVYTFGEMAGRAPAEAILDMQSTLKKSPLPPNTYVDWTGEGEWKITIDVFIDLGIAYGVALLGIYILLIIETSSFILPLLIMVSIPLTLLGIMPGFWLLNVISGGSVGPYATPIFFTATSMIGMIALGGIVIRNSLVLIDFIKQKIAEGMDLKEAIIQSGTIRLRPIVLTAATTALGAWPITLDPIFSGLAWALIFGLFASTLFTLIVVPTGYYALYNRKV
ncbi:MAG: efflux RND transporter permease subunit [Desulfovibrio sp.]